MIDLLILLLRPALLCIERKGWYLLLAPIALVAWIVDMLLAHTTWALIAGWPKKGEWTISHTLERLCARTNGERNPDYWLHCELALKINRVSPTGKHIKAVLA